jgi:hypothetical protein
MKNILVIAMLVPFALFGQKPKMSTTQGGIGYPTSGLIDTSFYIMNGRWVKYEVDAIKSNYDTVKVIMVVCDTARVHGSAYWQYGYEVRKKRSNDEGQIDPYFYFGHIETFRWEHIEYLDKNKKQLSKNIIVWRIR